MDRYDRQNLFIAIALFATQTGLLWTASQASAAGLVISAIAFSFLGLTVYALIHEACHHNLSSDPKVNGLMGTALSWLFPVSFTFMETVHQVHHLNNRTDSELFDYYYPDDNLFIKYGQWYSILIGIYPPIIPVGSVLLATVPSFFRLKPWRAARSSGIIFDRGLFTPQVLRRIRIEVFSGIAFWLLLFTVLELEVTAVLILYAAFWVNWSTRQYVSHAFSARDVIEGAWNLRVSTLMGWIFLNGQWDRVHHQKPRAPWQDLPELGKASEPPIAYWRQYWRLWKGPQPNREPAPKPLECID